MTDLIRNCAHYSTHQTLIDQRGGANDARTIKTTFTSDGVAGIQAENDGLRWYASRTGQDISKIILNFRATSGYARLETQYVDGVVIPMPTDPDTLTKKIDAAVDHYISMLWIGVDTPSHGDFSLSNHVFDNIGNVARIIDWEHFNRELPPQYDPLYMIVEPFLFWDVNGNTPSTDSITSAQGAISQLHDATKLPSDARQKPASWLRGTANAHLAVWGHQAGKLPFLNAPIRNITDVDYLLGTKSYP